MSKITFFLKKEDGPYSQWVECEFRSRSVVQPELAARTYYYAEQYMMAEKALLFGDENTREAILQSKSPKRQKALGREVRGFKEAKWKKWREQIVFQGNYCKFSQNERFKQVLLGTGDNIIAEAADYDPVWGIGMKASDPNAQDQSKWGLNLLGKALMEVRRQLREESEVERIKKMCDAMEVEEEDSDFDLLDREVEWTNDAVCDDF